MLNFVKSLNAARYAIQVSLKLGEKHWLLDSGRFPGVLPLMRRVRTKGLKASQCAELILSIARGASEGASNGDALDIAINAAMIGVESDEVLWNRPV